MLQLFRIVASSCTLRPYLGLRPGSEGSGATFEFPKNYFVWDFQKIDSRPYKSDPGLHFFFEHREISSPSPDLSGVLVLGA
jgi:hypothetical protein